MRLAPMPGGAYRFQGKEVECIMKKVLSAIAIALALCAPLAARAQTGNVRVGPSADDADADPVVARPEVKKSDEKKAAVKTEPKDEKKAVKTEPKVETKSELQKTSGEEKKTETEKTQTALPSTASAVPAVETSAGSVTSDAPSKVNASPVMAPPVATVKSEPPKNEPAKTEPPKTEPPKTEPAKTQPAKNQPLKSETITKTSATAAAPTVTPVAVATPTPAPAAAGATIKTTTAPPPSLPLTAIYRVGSGDILDIRLLNQTETRESTLYTVMPGGYLEYPLVGDPVMVAGMTTDEIGARLAAELQRRAVYEKPQMLVGVREYASHTVLVSGLVGDPGAKILRREAVPLYVVIAEAQPRPEAGRVTVIARATGQNTTIDLADPSAMNVLVHPGDVISVQLRPREFFYIGGKVSAPGQKDFHAGLTLTQAILASGGATRSADGKVRVARQGPDGRLVTTEYSLKDIEGGKVPDPRLQPGDRVEVGRGR